MGEDLVINPEDLVGLTDAEILKLVDHDWIALLEPVQVFLEDLWHSIETAFFDVVGKIWDKLVKMKDTIVGWFLVIKDWIKEKVTPIVSEVWGWLKAEGAKIWVWIKEEVGNVWDWIGKEVGKLWGLLEPWLQDIWGKITEKAVWVWDKIRPGLDELKGKVDDIVPGIASTISEINKWFSDEFIDPFIDWLVKLPANLWKELLRELADIWNRIVHAFTRGTPENKIAWYIAEGALAAMLGALAALAPAAITGATAWIGRVILSASRAFGAFFTALFSRISGWILAALPAIGAFAKAIGPTFLKWLATNWTGLATPLAVIGLEAAGLMDDLVRKFVTPLFVKMFDWAEQLGPVSPTSGKSVIEPLTGMIEITIGGLATMTLAGETLGTWKHIGMGHLSAMIYDLTNYKVLTAAFVGVLAGIYIKTPLTYYYNKIARPNIPDERTLLQLAGEYAITREEFNEGMAYQGYDDEWIPKLFELADRPLTPRLFTQIASVGILDDKLIDRELRNARYNELTIPYLKTWLQRVSTGELRTLMVGVAMTRYKEGLDNDSTLENNLMALGVEKALMPKYLFAAQLSYLTDYQNDLIAYYKDAYHRRDIEEPEFRSNLIRSGLLPERIDLAIDRERIKRLAAPKAAVPEEISIQFDTIRDRRSKLLITRDQEIEALIALGKELPYAIAIADNDDVKVAEKAVVVIPKPVPLYETEEGKIRVDTIRRLRRQRQITPEEEQQALVALEMPAPLAKAIVDNDEIRLRKETGSET